MLQATRIARESTRCALASGEARRAPSVRWDVGTADCPERQCFDP